MSTPGSIPTITIYGIEELKEVCKASSTWTIIDVIEDTESTMFAVQESWFADMWSRLGMPYMPIITYRANNVIPDRDIYLYPSKYDKCRDVWIEFNKGQKTCKDMESAISNCLVEDMRPLSESFVKEAERIRKAQDEKVTTNVKVITEIELNLWNEINATVTYFGSYFQPYCRDCYVSEASKAYFKRAYASSYDDALKTMLRAIDLLKNSTLTPRRKSGLIKFITELNNFMIEYSVASTGIAK